MIRGDVARKGPLVPRRFLKVLSAGEPPRFVEGSGRRELAATVASSKNPLFARVMVNRIWQSLFGQGIVRSTSNFGRMGDPPSHPQLLDAMAANWIEHDWSIKYLLREIVLSETYRQSSQHRQNAFDEDPTNLWLWRMNRKRLQVEAWRDAVLTVAGELDHAIGGKSIDPSLPNSNRRTLYAEVSRLSLNRMLASFDFPDPMRTVMEGFGPSILCKSSFCSTARSCWLKQSQWSDVWNERPRILSIGYKRAISSCLLANPAKPSLKSRSDSSGRIRHAGRNGPMPCWPRTSLLRSTKEGIPCLHYRNS